MSSRFLYLIPGAFIILLLVGGLSLERFPLSDAFLIACLVCFIFFLVPEAASRRHLLTRVEQLSLLDSISRDLTSHLLIEEVLTNIHQQVSRIVEVDTFYVALYNAELDLLEFPSAVEHGKRVGWSPVEANHARLTEHVVKQKKTIHIYAGNRQLYHNMGLSLPENYNAFAGIPLLVGDKVLGALCVITVEKDTLTADVVSMIQTISHPAALSLRNAVLYHQSMEMSRNLTLINNFVESIVFNPDAGSVFQSACEVATQIGRADRAAMFNLRDDHRLSFSLAYTLHMPDQHRVWLEQHPYRIEDFSQSSIIFHDAARDYRKEVRDEASAGGFRSKVDIPMRSGNTPVGVLVLYYEHLRYFRREEIEILETLSFQITAALDNAELLKTLESYASEQAQLVHLSRVSTSTLDLYKVMETVSDLLRHMLAVERVFVGLIDSPTDVIRIYNNGQVHEIPLRQLHDFVHLDTVPQLRDRESIPSELAQLVTNEDNPLLITASLVVSSDVIGLIALGVARPFSDAEDRLFELAVNQIAVQLHNAQQYHFIQEALNRRLRQLGLIENIAQQISSALNVEQLIGNVLDAAIQATQADMAALALVTDTGDFHIIGQEKVDGNWQVLQLKRSHARGIMGRVAKTRQPVIIPDNRVDPDYLATLTYGRYVSSLVVPLLKDDEVLGVLDIESKEPHFFKAEHAEFVESLAGHAVISIQNARLLQERQTQIEVLTHLRKLSLKLSSDTDRRSIIQAILQTALVVLQAEQGVMFGFTEDTHELTLLGSLKRTETGFANASIPLPDRLGQCAGESGEIQVIQDVRTSEFYEGYPYLEVVGYSSVVAAPIKHGNRVQEILCLTFERQRSNFENDLNTLELLLIQSAGHLENALLYERVKAGNDRLRTFLDASSEGIILLDAQGNLVQANVSAERLLNVDLSDYIGENFANRLLASMDHEDTNSDAHEGLRNMARILRLEPERILRRRFELRRRGQTTYIEEVSSPVIDSHHRSMGRLLILRDVTEEKLLEDYRNEITNMIVHDLRSPLSAIYSGLSYSKVLMDDPEVQISGEVVGPVLDVAINSTTNLLSLVDSLLDIAKLETRSMPLKKRATEIGPIVDTVINTISSLIQEAEIQIQINIPSNLPPAFIDESKIRRVVVNLLDNAQRFSPQGGVVLIEAVEQQHKILMRIADSGKGIPPEERERIFEKFRQATTNAPARGRKGSGLGLTFCKLVLEAHGEQIWVEDQGPLGGASFAFTLPIFVGQVDE
jgi:PAS domain S-box-containing protein